MSETERPRSTLRSIGAVVAGLLFIFIVSTVIDVVMHATGVFPPWGKPMSDALFGLATAYRIVVSVTGAAVTWNKGPEFGPHWYPLLLIVISIPCGWLGGKFFEMRRPK